MSLISGVSHKEVAYEPTLWAKLFHSAPHVNITFHSVNPRFNPENDLYLEALGILASVPAAWLITTLVVLLIYLCTRCCDTKSSKKRKSRPIRCCLSFFSLVTVTALALGFLGNHEMHTGMEAFERATGNIRNFFDRSQKMAERYNEVFQTDIEKNMNRLYEGPFQRDIHADRNAHFNIMSWSDDIFRNISTGLEAMDELRFKIDSPKERFTFQNIPLWARAVEKYRWPATMAIQALFALFCLLLFVGAIVHSRCVLILFSVCGLFSIILLWLLASVYTATSVAVADFCYNPTPWVQHYLSPQLEVDVTDFYLRCRAGGPNPFEAFLSKSSRAIEDIDIRVRQISASARKHYSSAELSPFLDDLEENTEEMSNLMNELVLSLRCDPIYRSYNTALVAVCDSGLFGLILMLISVAFSGLLFTILVWCNSHTWIYFKHKGRYIKVDDQDPYMPLSTIERPRLSGGPTPVSMLSAHNTSTLASTAAYHNRRNIHTPPQTPPYHGTLNGASHAATMRSHAPTAYGHVAGSAGATAASAQNWHRPSAMSSATMQHQHHGHGSRSNMLAAGTLGRHMHQTGAGGGVRHGGYQGMDNLPATMTLGRRGHYASLRTSGAAGGVGGRGGGDHEAPLLGPNMGQYATLSKQCKTLESSDFY